MWVCVALGGVCVWCVECECVWGGGEEKFIGCGLEKGSEGRFDVLQVGQQ